MKWLLAALNLTAVAMVMGMAVVVTVPALAGEAPLEVAVSLLPQSGVVERVGGDRVRVLVLVEHGQEPHSFRPSARRVTELARAAVWFTSGMAFEEALVAKLGGAGAGAGNGPRIASLAAEGIGAEGLASQCEAEPGTEGGEAHAHHDHGSWDPHVWTAPLLVGRQGRAAAKVLAELDPAHAAGYAARADALEREAAALHAELGRKLAPLKGSVFYVFHPAFAYFAAAYGLEQVAIESGGREPSAKRLTELVERARRDGVTLVLVQPQHLTRGAERVAKAIGAKVVELDPLAKDVFGTMRRLADLLVEARP